MTSKTNKPMVPIVDAKRKTNFLLIGTNIKKLRRYQRLLWKQEQRDAR